MQLHGSYTSPYVRQCRIALRETGLEHEFIETDFEQSLQQSPTARVPFLDDGDLVLTDSASILKYIREKAGESFCVEVRDYDLFLLASTALDTTVNLFLLERDGITPEQSPYLERQRQRITGCLAYLDETLSGRRPASGPHPFTDGELRVGCYLSWGLFRERIRFYEKRNLCRLLDQLDKYAPFAETHPNLSRS